MSTVTSTYNGRPVTPGAYVRSSEWFVDLLLSFYLCGAILVVFLLLSPETRHWFVVPVLGCGTLIGVDSVRVVRGKLEVFEPNGLIGIVGIHFFFFAPLLHVSLNRWMRYVSPPPDWRDWLGRMAILNLIGLLAFLLVRAFTYRSMSSHASAKLWRLNESSFRTIVTIALAGTAVLQVGLYYQFGGVIGYINSYEEGGGDFSNLGILFSVAESFPILAMMAFVVWARRRGLHPSWAVLGVVLVAYLVIALMFGGLRGSRGNTIWALFWAVGIIHFWIRPAPRKILLGGAVFAVAFMYSYAFYKSLGTDAFDVIASERSIASLEEESGRSMEGVLLGDLARSDIQAFLLYRLSPKPEGVDYEYASGRTYVGALALVIPRWVWPDRPPTKRVEGTDAQYGTGAHLARSQLSTRVYGLAGEGMLNFGPIVVPLLYACYGAVVGFAQRWRDGIGASDSRLLLVPFVAIMAFYFLVWDSDNILFFFFKRGAIPLAVLLLSSAVVRSPGRGAA